MHHIYRSLVLLSTAVLCATACHSSGLGIAIVSPADASDTDAIEVTVLGTTSGDAKVQSVLVNGVPASTQDGFHSWSAVVRTEEQHNVVEAVATDVGGHTASAVISVNGVGLAASASPERIDFVAGSAGLQPPAQDLVVSFGGTAIWLATPPAWLSIEPPADPTASPATFKVSVANTFYPNGTALTGALAFATERNGRTRTFQVPVTLTLFEQFDAIAPKMPFTSVRGSIQPPRPAAGYAITIRGQRARWHLSGPAWSRFSQTSGTGPATVTITADATGLPLGVYSSQVTVADDESGGSRTLPVVLECRVAQLVVPQSALVPVDNLTTTAGLSQPLAVTDELGGTLPSESVSWRVRSASVPWLHVTPATGQTSPGIPATVSVDASALASLPPGPSTASITLEWQNQQLSNQTDMVLVTVDVRLAHVDFASPHAGVAGRAGTLILRGRRFTNTGGPVTAVVGTTELPGLTPDSDTQLRVSYPALPAGRYPVSIENALGVTHSDADLVVAAQPAFAYHAIPVSSIRNRLIWDAERQALFGSSPDGQRIERYRFSGGAWSADPPFFVSEVTDLALAPNGRSLIVLQTHAVGDIQLANEPWTFVTRAENRDFWCNQHMKRIAMTNSGKAFIVKDCSSPLPALLYDVLGHSLVELGPDSAVSYGEAVATGDGSRIYAGDYSRFEVYDALTEALAPATIQGAYSGLTTSSDGARVIVGKVDVYDRSLAHTGSLGTPPAAVLISNDSTKAFAYRSDNGQQRIEISDLTAAPQSGTYPVVRTIALPDSPGVDPYGYWPIVMAVTPDDSVLFISGAQKLLVVPL